MKPDIFVDTSGFYSLLSLRDTSHNQAALLLHNASQSNQLFVTTDYVIDETATLLCARGIGHLAPVLFETVQRSKACRMEWMDRERFARTQGFFEKHADHGWSFTDCFSFVVMKELKITRALTKDKHFEEAGYLPLLQD